MKKIKQDRYRIKQNRTQQYETYVRQCLSPNFFKCSGRYLNGYLTIYLSLILAFFLCVILTLVEGARINTMKLNLECAADIGMNSVLAEFNRELMEQYDLLFVDMSYGSGEAAIQRTESHLRHYVNGNFGAIDGKGSKVRDWLALSVHQVKISEYRLATDFQGKIMRNQAISYQKQKGLLGIAEELSGKLEQAKKWDEEKESLQVKREENKNEIAAIDLPVEIKEDGSEVTMEIDNPADRIEQYRGIGILNLVLQDTKQLSPAAIYPQEYLTGRTLKKGNMELKSHESNESFTDRLYFIEYIMDKFGNYTNSLKKSLFQYQLEYLLSGNDIDWKNLEKVANSLILWREAANLAYLFTDKSKIAQARAAAYGLAAVAQVPALAEPITTSILFGWAYLESLSDVKLLLGGGKVPLVKSAADWKTDLEDLLGFGGSLKSVHDSGNGLDYKQYLGLMLLLEEEQNITMRAMDLIEMDLRRTNGNRKFRMDSCLERMTADLKIGSKYGYTFDIAKTYGY